MEIEDEEFVMSCPTCMENNGLCADHEAQMVDGAGHGSAEVIAWLEERRENCVRIAGSKRGADSDGWLSDAAYFADAIRLLTHP